MQPNEDELRRIYTDALGRLDPQERRVLELWYGLPDGERLDLKEIGVELGITQGVVARTKHRAERKLRADPISRAEMKALGHVLQGDVQYIYGGDPESGAFI